MDRRMEYFDAEAIKIRDLRYFVTIVEQGSISAAAKKLYVAQPALSRKLKELELATGTALFLHKKNTISLTEAGQLYYGCVKKILAEYQALFEEMNQMTIPYAGSLRVGYIPNLRPLHYVTSIEKFRNKYPQSQLELVSCPGGKQVVEKVLSGEVDCGYCSQLYVKDISQLAYKRVALIRSLVVTKSNSELSVFPEISLKALVGRTLILPPRERAPAHVALLEKIIHDSGLSFQIQYADTVDNLLFLVKCNAGVGFLASGNDIEPQTGLVGRPLAEDSEPRYRVVTWRKENQNPGIRCFLKIIGEEHRDTGL